MKRREPGSAHAALYQLCHEIGVKRVADFVGVSEFTIHKQLDPDQPSTELSYLRVAQITEHFGPTIAAEDLARRAGGVFIPLPAAAPAPSAVDGLLRSAETNAHALSTGWAAYADGRLTPDERAEFLGKLDAAIQANMSLRLLVEATGRG